MSKKNQSILVQGTQVKIQTVDQHDYICLTDMVSSFDGKGALIENWLKNKDTVDFLGAWEQINNPDFNSLEFEGIRNEAGRNSFFLSAKKWINATHAIGIIAKAGRYGGTYAHRDIAFEFGSWLSPEFKLYLIKEFQRLKDDENQRLSLSWNLNRTLSRINYRIHTDAIKQEREIRPGDTVVSAFRDGRETLRKNRRTGGFTNSLKELGYQGIRKGDRVVHAMNAFAGATGVPESDGKSIPVYSALTERKANVVNPYYYSYILGHMVHFNQRYKRTII